MELAGRVTLAVLFLSLVVCVLGRPQPSLPSPRYSAAEVFEKSAVPASSRILEVLHFGTLEVPWRRALRGGSGGRGGGSRGVRVGGGGGGGSESTTVTIIVVVSVVIAVILLAALFTWWIHKKKKNPNWRLVDCFKRKKPGGEKMFPFVKSDVNPDTATGHEMAIDVPRLDHAAKSRRQVSTSHDFKTSTSSS